MFEPMIHVLALRKLGLTKPFLLLILIFLLGCLVAGIIYAAVVLHAVTKANEAPHVHSHHSR